MAKSLNRVTLIGNLGKDPELRSTPQGRSVTTLTLATTERYKDRNGNWQDITDWHRVVLWDRLAEVACEHLRKGSKVYIEGKLKTRNYEDKQGILRYVTEVLASNMVMMTVRREDNKDENNDVNPPLDDDTPVDEDSYQSEDEDNKSGDFIF